MLRCVVKNSHHCSHGRLQSIRSFRLTPPFLWDQSGVNQWDSELSCAPFSLRLDPFYLLWVYHGLFHSWSNPCVFLQVKVQIMPVWMQIQPNPKGDLTQTNSISIYIYLNLISIFLGGLGFDFGNSNFYTQNSFWSQLCQPLVIQWFCLFFLL